MKKNIFIILGILISFYSIAQSPNIEWQKSLGGTDFDGISWIIQATDNNYIVAGHTNSNDGNVTGNHGDVDIWVVKLNTLGEIIWQKTLGGTDSEYATSIQETSDGGYIIAGFTESNNGDVTFNHSISFNDFWIVKLNVTGAIMWEKSLGGTGHDSANSIKQTSDGGYIVAGQTDSNDGDVNGNHSTFLDCWIVKLNSIGEIVWQKTLGGTNYDSASEVIQTSDNGFILAGNTSSNNGDVTEQNGISDYWIVKLNSIGEIIWQKSLGGTHQDSATSIQQTFDGGYIVAGNTYSNDGDVTENQGDLDVWIVKLNNIGEIIWQKSFGGTGTDYASRIQQRLDGSYIIVGSTYSNDGDVSGNHTSDNILSDCWILKINSTGTILWQKTLGGTDSDGASSIYQTSDVGYIMAGGSGSNDGDVTGNHGNSDGWLVKLSPDNLYLNESIHLNYTRIYPNPSYNYIIIQNSESSLEFFDYKILDLTGRIVSGGKSKFNEKINIENLKIGNYIIQIQTINKNIINKKLIKN